MSIEHAYMYSYIAGWLQRERENGAVVGVNCCYNGERIPRQQQLAISNRK